ncbi:hypothetical protein ACFVS2_25435 [Brevibacillus sp. NPDC058079]|uniref:hypothetical protein n=1 Tax=Brevibacillus sp. NPDC058079 TaxID=3346330 RepID=UPI0036F04B01
MLHLTDQEMENISNKFVKEYQKKVEERNTFTKTKQDEGIYLLARYVKEHQFLDGDSREFAELSSKEFHFLFDNVMDVAEELGKVGEDENAEFPNKMSFLKVNDVHLIFFIMWGQGTCTQVYVNQEEWQDELSFTYEQMKETQVKLKETE